MVWRRVDYVFSCASAWVFAAYNMRSERGAGGIRERERLYAGPARLVAEWATAIAGHIVMHKAFRLIVNTDRCPTVMQLTA
jgi:hypothetical protein